VRHGVRGDGGTEGGAVHVGGAEVHPAPAPRVDQFGERAGEAGEVARRAYVVIRAAVPQACPDGYSGNGGVTSRGIHAGSAPVRGLPSVSASWIAVTGRQKRATSQIAVWAMSCPLPSRGCPELEDPLGSFEWSPRGRKTGPGSLG
jgi:hypothetical protein